MIEQRLAGATRGVNDDELGPLPRRALIPEAVGTFDPIRFDAAVEDQFRDIPRQIALRPLVVSAR